MDSLACPRLLPQDNHNQKRRRGGQQGNKNALKHGFYTGFLGPLEMDEILNTVSKEGLEPELALLRIKLFASLRSDPGNLRVLREASRLLTRWYASRFQLSKTESLTIKKLITGILRSYVSLPSSPAREPSEPVVLYKTKQAHSSRKIKFKPVPLA